MTSKRVNLILVVMIGVWLLAGWSYFDLTPSRTMTASTEHLEPSYLVVIALDKQNDRQRLAALELDLLDLQENAAVAIVTSPELTILYNMRFDVRILDAPATPEQYYLVTLPPSQETVPLQHGQVFAYVTDRFILKADRAEAELFSRKGFFMQKLFGPIVLPTSPPSPGAATGPTTHIQAYNPLIQTVLNTVSQTQLYNTIRDLQDDDASPGWDTGRSRYTFSPELAIERDYIRGRMEALGLDVRYQNFNYWGSLDNIEGTLPGWGPNSETVYIVCAHYDSVSGDPYTAAPGADDNASGTAAVLEAARVLSQYRFKRTLRFVTFPAEEQGLIGSYYYAQEASTTGTVIGGVINHDMIAWDFNGDNVMEIHAGTRSNSQALGTAFLNAISTYSIPLVPEYITVGAATASDHTRFWNRGYPAILVIEDFEDFNPYYHQTSDTLAKLNLPYATKFVQATTATLAELAEIIPPGVRITHPGPGAVMTNTLTALTVEYANPGPDLAANVVITETLSPGLTYLEDNSSFAVTQPTSDTVVWQVGQVLSHTQSSFVVTVSVAANLPVGSHVTSTVETTGTIAWDDPADNQAVWTGFVASDQVYLPIVFKPSGP
jgi:uncharacterized repeat protein (TIGR01451 family)